MSNSAPDPSTDPVTDAQLKSEFDSAYWNDYHGVIADRPPASAEAAAEWAWITATRRAEQRLRSSGGAGTEPKFQVTYCSQCGGEFGPGNSGYSHCADHLRGSTAEDYITRLPADWFKDSSLEKWFPLTAEELARLRNDLARAYMRLQCADVPRDPWHWEVCAMLNGGAPVGGPASPGEPRTERGRWESTGLCGCTGELVDGERPFACEHGFKTELQRPPEPADRLEFQPLPLSQEDIAAGVDVPLCARCGRRLLSGHSHESRWYCSSETKDEKP